MILIKPMVPEHIDTVYDIECECFTTPWRKSTILQEITSETPTVYIAALYFEPFRAPEVVGYAGMWHVVDEGHITNLAVTNAHRRKGIAKMLLDYLTEIAAQREMQGLTLEVRVGNTAAQNLYTQHGFAIEGCRKGYYSDTGEDAFIMWKHLTR